MLAQTVELPRTGTRLGRRCAWEDSMTVGPVTAPTKLPFSHSNRTDAPRRVSDQVNESLLVVDHSARKSMKNAASCVNWCELQTH